MGKGERAAKPVNASKERLSEEDDEETLLHFVKTQVRKFFVNHIPMDSIKELPDHYLYAFGTVAHGAAIGIFVYFLYVGYSNAINQAYISLDENNGNCNTVSISISGSYLADSTGNWQGTPDFLDSDATYQLSFSNFEVSSINQYTNMMNTFYSSLVYYGSLATQNNLAYNVVIWATWLRYYSLQYPDASTFKGIGFGQLQTLALTGDPTITMELEHNLGNVGSAEGICHIESFAQYDQSNGILSLQYQNVSAYQASSACTKAMDLESFGYVSDIDHNAFTVDLDVRSMMVSMAVNYNLLALSDMQPMFRTPNSFTYQGVNYTVGEYYDSHYSLMKSILCVQNVSEIPRGVLLPQMLCMMVYGSTFVLPMFNHYGASSSRPMYCSCSDGVGKSEDCQVFNFLSGLLFYNNVDESSVPSWVTIRNAHGNATALLSQFGLFHLMDLVGKYGAYENLNTIAYNASFVTTTPTYICGTRCVTRTFKFCEQSDTSTGGCSLLMFDSSSSMSTTVSPYKYQLVNGSCSSSFVIAQSSWQKLVDNPPVQFTQTYYECYETQTSALLTSLGVASGNSALFVPLAVICLLPLVYLLLVSINQVPPKEEYAPTEKAQVVDILSVLLLRLRDGKTRSLRKDGVLVKLAKEIIAAAKEEGGYPDSDDEDDDPSGQHRDSISPMHHPETPKKSRHRLAVFTKQLTQPSELPKLRPRQSEASGMEMTTMPGVMSYSIGPSSFVAAEAQGVHKYLDLLQNQPPKDVLVLNAAAAQRCSSAQGHLKTNELALLLDDLLTSFSEALSFNPDNADEGDSDDEEREQSPRTRRDCQCFVQGETLSGRLARVDIAQIMASSDGAFFVRLANILCIHASVALDLEMRFVGTQYSARVAYNVGNRMMTVADLQSAI